MDRLPCAPSFLPPAVEPKADDELPEALPAPGRRGRMEGAGADTVRVLAEVLPTLPPGRGWRAARESADPRGRPAAARDAVDRLAGLEKEPEWWWRLYDSLAVVDPDSAVRAPGAPAVPTWRTTIGPRQVLLPTSGRGPARSGCAGAAGG
ncbi:hypothetical protein GCM10017687_49490 [Streptomyces echinatus]